MSWGRNTYRGSYYGFAPYVPVAKRKAKAAAKLKKLQAKGTRLNPVILQGRTIASTFWGKAWCRNLESYMDYANRLPRGRSYVRHGAVLHLDIKPGEVAAKVDGSSLYTVKIKIAPVVSSQWRQLCQECAGQIGSLLELLAGTLSDRVMGVMTRKKTGLFPAPQDIQLTCSCPDSATMCKHVAAVLYGVGARLDQRPDLLFLLRSVDQAQLISHAVEADITAGTGQADAGALGESDLADVFGIEIDTAAAPPAAKNPRGKKSTTPKPVVKKPAVKKAVRRASRVMAQSRKRSQLSTKAWGIKKTAARSTASVAQPVKAAPAKKRGRPKGAKDKQPRRKRAGS
ncbi:MAG: SWIM zinc finger family protein [Kiritimatiellae bacterium]|jgi:uncharacterized Zn finger protein|nr:SWIM zinc finger family protein [Kiritimatiellia bacterium]MDD4341604.1 SWIM zinc finger family protein [Kiritimatiellia bacterium]MDY0149678.1 SWIM zinc finger family protein [Kiritimatiellia bacterium]